jgi:hypothetical protein
MPMWKASSSRMTSAADTDLLSEPRADPILRGEGGRFSLENNAKLVDLVDVLDADRRDAVALPRYDLDEALLAEERKGFADRRLADSELAGELRLDQQIAAEDFSKDDSIPQLRVDGIDESRFARGIGATDATAVEQRQRSLLAS